jgi:hypothetical protein
MIRRTLLMWAIAGCTRQDRAATGDDTGQQGADTGQQGAEFVPPAGAIWSVSPPELVFQTERGTTSVRELALYNPGPPTTLDLGPVIMVDCPEEPFLPVPSKLVLATASVTTLRVEHAPSILPATGVCVGRLRFTEPGSGASVAVRLDGGVIAFEEP